MDTNKTRKILRSLCHGSALASYAVVSVGVPIVVLLVSDDPLVRDSAKEALNFMISQIIWACILVGLCFTVIGIPVAIIGAILSVPICLIFPIVAIASVLGSPERRYRYPFTFRLIPMDKKPALIHE